MSCKVDLLIAEPLAIQKCYHQSIWLLRNKFNAVFCRYGYYARRYSNVHQLAVVESWVDGRAVNLTLGKLHYCSIIASAKQDLTGHKLWHAPVAWVRQVAPPFRSKCCVVGMIPLSTNKMGCCPTGTRWLLKMYKRWIILPKSYWIVCCAALFLFIGARLTLKSTLMLQA